MGAGRRQRVTTWTGPQQQPALSPSRPLLRVSWLRTPASRLTAWWRSCSPQFPFMLGQPHYGAKGEVLKINPEHKGKIQLKFTVHPEPDLSGFVSRHFTESYMLGYRVAQTTGISGHVVSRITATIFVVRGAREQQFDSASKSNIG